MSALQAASAASAAPAAPAVSAASAPPAVSLKRKRRSTQEYSLKAREGWAKRRARAEAVKKRDVLAPVYIAPRTFKQATGVFLKEYCAREGIAQQYCTKEAKAAAKAATEKYAHWLMHTAAACAAARKDAGGTPGGMGLEGGRRGTDGDGRRRGVRDAAVAGAQRARARAPITRR